ncbi:hypothetical protein C5167_050269 [Papaver somniferum]|uniref:Uncharacterized protein n=1 Tax=Papaver somniferum TaxID=3469 RepID=A0A4Y7KN68_PAPSO|nr:hypothetical protein C5167_050269 [Papaver somniferum]
MVRLVIKVMCLQESWAPAQSCVYKSRRCLLARPPIMLQ